MPMTITLPTYTRRTPGFEDVFGVPAPVALRAMDEAGDDLVQGRPGAPIALTDVGCRRERLIVQLRDPFDPTQVAPAVCAITIGTAVPASRRGLHMSRIGDAVADAVQEVHRDAGALAEWLAERVERTQYGGPTSIDVEAVVPYLERVPDEGRPGAKQSVEHLVAYGRATTAGGGRTDRGLRVTHIVACPCVQRTAWHARAALGVDAALDAPPGFTHAQRCETTAIVQGAGLPLPMPDVLAELDQVLCRTMSTLPRASELLLVFRAHRSPQFVEDAVRAAAGALFRAWPAGAPFDAIEVSARSLESIHEFDLSATARVTRDEAEQWWAHAPAGADR